MLYKISSFPEPYTYINKRIKVELCNKNFAKTKIAKLHCFDTSIKICKKADLIRLDVSKLETTPVALTKLSDIVKKWKC